MKITTKKITYAGLLIAIGVLLPQIFHIFGQQAGKVFLPIHICVFLGGLTLGPLFGLALGIITPWLSSLLTGMPPMPQAVFMVFELSAYGVCAGLFRKKCNVYISLILAQVCGRAAYGLILFAAGQLLSVNVPAVYGIWTAFIAGLPGIVIQIILIPLAVKLLERGGVLEFERTEKPPV